MDQHSKEAHVVLGWSAQEWYQAAGVVRKGIMAADGMSMGDFPQRDRHNK